MTAQERQVVENKISELKKEMNEVHGSKCEVYSRVVGYLRPVQNWNKGKKEEFAMRKPCTSAALAAATAKNKFSLILQRVLA